MKTSSAATQANRQQAWRGRKFAAGLVLGLLLAAACSLDAQAEKADEPDTPPSTSPASSDTQKTEGGSFLDRLKNALPKARPAPDAANATTEESAADTASPKAKSASGPGFLDRVKNVFSGDASTTKIKDINTVSTVSSKVLDPTCQNLVEPFGITDNVASLGFLMAKMKVTEIAKSMGTSTAGNSQQLSALNAVKQAAKGLNWLPMPAETLIGESMHKDAADRVLSNSGKNTKLYETANRALQDVLDQIKEAHPYKFTLYILKSDGKNASALPGGFIYVDKGLVNTGYLHFAIAHEVAHVLQRHQTREYQSRLIDSVDSFTGLTKLLDMSQSSPAAVVTYLGSLKNLFLQHSEDQELQADACSARLVTEYAKSNLAAASEIQKYADSLPKVVAKPAPVSSVPVNPLLASAGVKDQGLWDGKFERHPNSATRIANLAKMVMTIRTQKPVAQK